LARLHTARKNGRVGGRPSTMHEEKIRSVKSILKDTENYPFISDIIQALNIDRTTFYRHFPPFIIASLRSNTKT
jgi:DNA invertase Pin-like site-specific DNA recombinase